MKRKKLDNSQVHVIDSYYSEGYDQKITIMTFPKKWNRRQQKKWLLDNHYPTGDERYNVGFMYDCTGDCHTTWVDFRKNRVKFTQCFDI